MTLFNDCLLLYIDDIPLMSFSAIIWLLVKKEPEKTLFFSLHK